MTVNIFTMKDDTYGFCASIEAVFFSELVNLLLIGQRHRFRRVVTVGTAFTLRKTIVAMI